MIVLGIETSCDETGIALYHSERGLLAHVLHSQIELHADYGGVVPELASRDHIRFLSPLIRQVLQQSGISTGELGAVAYTAGPGLIGALLSGAALGRSLAWALGVPALEVHHMEGHLLAPMLEPKPPQFPFVALLVSGGHTLLAQVDGIGQYHILGQSLDDAAGEAFDKTAKIMGLGYPGGPALARLATNGKPKQYRFPRPMTDRPGLDFSFSGLKTFALTTLQALDTDAIDYQQQLADVACAFEEAVVDTLVIKSARALDQQAATRLVIAGGVGANLRLREKLAAMVAARGGELFYPRIDFCTDNGAMIAHAGCLRLLAGEQQALTIAARARWPMEQLSAL